MKDREDAFRRQSQDWGSALRFAPLRLHESGSESFHRATREEQPGPAAGRGRGRRRPADTAPDEAGNSSDLVEPQGSDHVVVYVIPGYPDYSEAVGALVAAGAQVDARARDGRTPLHVAAAQRGEGTVGVLLDAGADSTARTVDGKTPFDLAEGLRGTDAYRRLRDALIP